MAGMDWFRWHHGSVTDPKFALVARKAGASVPDVLAVWAYILETASQSVERGDFGTVDCEALDCVFGFPSTETRTADILAAMEGRELTKGTRIVAWEKRQPKRERDDPTNADRQATYRANQNQVTPDNASASQKTPRGEKSRGDKKEKKSAAAPPEGVSPQTWEDWLHLRKSKRAPVTETTVDGARKEAALAGMTLDAFLKVWCTRGSQGLEAAWLTNGKPSKTSTVPGTDDIDPALLKIEADRKRAVPIPENIRAALFGNKGAH